MRSGAAFGPPPSHSGGWPRGPMGYNGCEAERRGAPMTPETQTTAAGEAQVDGKKDTLTVTDNRTGKTYEIPVEDGTIRGIALRDVKVDDDDFGLMSYDPAYLNTASCRSAITYIDGDQGIL